MSNHLIELLRCDGKGRTLAEPFSAGEMHPVLCVVGLFKHNIPAMVDVLEAKTFEPFGKGLGGGARRADADETEGDGTRGAGRWRRTGVDVVFEEWPVPG